MIVLGLIVSVVTFFTFLGFSINDLSNKSTYGKSKKRVHYYAWTIGIFLIFGLAPLLTELNVENIYKTIVTVTPATEKNLNHIIDSTLKTLKIKKVVMHRTSTLPFWYPAQSNSKTITYLY